MRSLFLLATAAVALAAPLTALAASPDVALDAFRSVCVAHTGDYVATLKAADQAGWQNSDLKPAVDSSVTVLSQQSRATTIGGENLTLWVSQGLQHMKNGDNPETTCRIESSKAHAGVLGETESWLGLKPDGGDNTLAWFFVTGTPDKLVHLTSATIPHDGMSMIKVQPNSDSVILIDLFYAGK